MKWLKPAFAAFLFFAALGSRAETPDDQFVRIYNLIQQADDLRIQGQSRTALEKFREAEEGLKSLKQTSPNWNPKVVQFRLNYLADRIAPLQVVERLTPSSSSRPPASAPLVPAIPQSKATSAANELESQLKAAGEQLRQLGVEKLLLEAKLREALSAQPASVDPRELAKAQQELKQLTKEHEVLKVTLDQEKSKAANAITPEQYQAAVKALAEAKKEMGSQTQTLSELNAEKNLLQSRLKALKETDVTHSLQTENENLKKQLAAKSGNRGKDQDQVLIEELNRRLKLVQGDLAEQKSRNEILQTEKAVLEKRSKQLASKAPKTQEAANAVGEKEIAELRAAVKKHMDRVTELEKNLAMASEDKAQLKREKESWQKKSEDLARDKAALEREKEAWGKDRVALEARLEATSKAVVKSAAPAPVVDDGRLEAERKKVRELEKERDNLRAQLKTAEKDLSDRKAKASVTQNEKLAKEIASLKARMAAMEAKKIPYTKEELALFKAPERLALVKPKPVGEEPKSTPGPRSGAKTELAASTPNGGEKNGGASPKAVNEPRKKVEHAWPAGSGTLISQAQTAFAGRRLEEAESAYQEVLKLDPMNPNTLANLGVVQMEQNRLADAEVNIVKAVEVDGEDSYALSLLGILRFRQGKYDDALDALSHSTKIDPENAEAQNFLGITLSQKGQRAAAEAALRRAIQITPGYASAHQNLAVVYATQKPPFLELARWHYQKSQSGGQPRNEELEKLLGMEAAR